MTEHERKVEHTHFGSLYYCSCGKWKAKLHGSPQAPVSKRAAKLSYQTMKRSFKKHTSSNS